MKSRPQWAPGPDNGLAASSAALRVACGSIFDRVGRLWRPVDFRFTPIATDLVQCHQMNAKGPTADIPPLTKHQ